MEDLGCAVDSQGIVAMLEWEILGPVYMEWGTPVYWGGFLLFSRSGGHKTKETYPTRPGSPSPCKQGLRMHSGLPHAFFLH